MAPSLEVKPQEVTNALVEQWVLQDRVDSRRLMSKVGGIAAAIAATALFLLAPESVKIPGFVVFTLVALVDGLSLIALREQSGLSKRRLGLVAVTEQCVFTFGLAWIMVAGASDPSLGVSHRIIGWVLYTAIGALVCDTSRSLPWVGMVGAIAHVGVALVVWHIARHDEVISLALTIFFTDGNILVSSYRRLQNLRILARLNIEKAGLSELNERLQREALETELEVASRIQTSLTAEPATLSSGHSTVICFHEPFGILGGDWMATRRLRNGTIVIAVADVSGKGIPAAMVVQSIQALWAYALNEPEFSAESWITAVNNVLITLGAKEPHTLTMGLLTVDQHFLTYYCAGHVPLVLIRNSDQPESAEMLQGSGGILGLSKNLVIQPTVVSLPVGVPYTILLGTDGVFDWHTRRSRKALLKLLAQVQRDGREAIVRLPTADDKILVVIRSQKQQVKAA